MASAQKTRENLEAALQEALNIQHRFQAEPLFAKTGRGYLKSEGVTPLAKIKARKRRSPTSAAQ